MAYIDTKDIRKVKAVVEDLLVGIGKDKQTRVTGEVEVTKINAGLLQGLIVVDTIDELKALDINVIGSKKLVIVSGKVKSNDRLGGLYLWDATNVTPGNDETVVQLISYNIGRFIKVNPTKTDLLELQTLISNDITAKTVIVDTLCAKANIEGKANAVIAGTLNTKEIITDKLSVASKLGDIVAKSVVADKLSTSGDFSADNVELNTVLVNNELVTEGPSTFKGNTKFEAEVNATNIEATNFIGENLNVTNIINDNRIFVKQNTTIEGDLEIGGKLTFTESDNIKIDIPNKLQLKELNVSGATNFSGVTNVNNNFSVAGNTKILGVLEANEINGIRFNVRAEDNLPVTGVTRLVVDDSVTINGKLTSNANAVINGSLSVSGELVSNDRVTAQIINTGSLNVEKDFTAKKNLIVKRDIDLNGDILPKDETSSLGSKTRRFKQLFAINSAIQVSDDRTKDYLEIDYKERLAAKEMLTTLRKFKRKTGDRIHFGVSAQSVKKVLENNGLNPDDYAFLCKDEIFDNEGNIVEMYAIRYEELYAFILLSL